MTIPAFDMESALKALREGKDLAGKDGILTPLIKQLTEATMQAELDEHLASETQSNRKNGSTSKTMKSPVGSFELNSPRESLPLFLGIVPGVLSHRSSKNIKPSSPMNWSEKCWLCLLWVIATRIFAPTLVTFTACRSPVAPSTPLPELQAWRERDLEAIYPIVWLDAIHYKIKENGRYISKAIYTILGLNIDGKKELLGLYLSDNEGAHHWLSVLTDLHNRGVNDILIVCIDTQSTQCAPRSAVGIVGQALPAVTPTTHALRDAIAPQMLSEFSTGVLATLV